MPEQITYTLILHQIRKKLKLTLMEYCVADCIYHLSNNPQSKLVGWCWASKDSIASLLGTTAKTIFETIPKLITKELIEKDENTKHLRTTQKWYESVVLVRATKEYNETLGTITKGDTGLSRKVIGTITKGDTIIIDTNKDNKSDSPSARTPHQEVVELFDYFKSEYLDKVSDAPPIFAWGKCEALAKPYLKSFGLEKMKSLIDEYFSRFDKFYKKVGWSLDNFLTANTINSLLNGK